MNFATPIFGLLLCLTYFFFFCAQKHPRAQLFILLLASIAFYSWLNRLFLLVILGSCAWNFCFGLALSRKNHRGFLWLGILGNLAALCAFKYFDFFAPALQSLLSVFGLTASWTIVHVGLPLGISFFTFQAIGYLADVAKGEIHACTSPLEFCLFILAFPQLVAGPIVKAKDFLPQLRQNLAETVDVSGVFYIVYGLVKKLLIADSLGFLLVDKVFANPTAYGGIYSWLAFYGFGFQLYFDFSGYSDIAIGLGKIFGLELPANFKAALFVDNPVIFWRRWHITLTRWIHDYIYQPLATRAIRKSKILFIGATLLSFLLIGIWHGAQMRFIVFGVGHGALLIGYSWISRKRWFQTLVLPRFVKVFVFFHILCLLWSVFRAESLSNFLGLVTSMLQPVGAVELPLFGISLAFLTGALLYRFVETTMPARVLAASRIHWALQTVLILIVFVVFGFTHKYGVHGDTFIYFQF